MLTIDKRSDNRIDITLSGALDADAMRAGLHDLLDKAEGMEHGQMLYRIPDFAMPSLGAIMVELGLLPRLFSLLHRFDRCAVLSDAPWLRQTAEVKGAIIPGLTIRAFGLEEEAAAEAWLAVPGG